MPFIQKATGYNKPKPKTLGALFYSKRTPFPIKVGLAILYLSLLFYTVIAVFVEFLIGEPECGSSSARTSYTNPDYDSTNCQWRRLPSLGFLSPMECELTRRLLISVLLGAAIGWERRDSDRPAGIRTMSLVSLGACLFTLTSMFSFMDGPMSWDASRVAAAIPSGVGFLGAGLIWKGSVGSGDDEVHQVHGLTTAASVWLSAAVGVAAGGGLFFIASYCVALIIVVLRFGPRMYGSEDSSSHAAEEDDDSQWDTDGSSQGRSGAVDDDNVESGPEGGYGYGSVATHPEGESARLLVSSEAEINIKDPGSSRKRPKRRKSSSTSSLRNVPSFHS